MDPERKKHLQKLWLPFLDNISEYKGIIDGLYTQGILTDALKERVVLKQGKDQLREILDILPKRGNKAFDVFYDVLVKCDEDVAADLLCPERAEQRRSQASKSLGPAVGIQESYQTAQPALPDDDELPARWPDFDSHDPSKLSLATVGPADQLMKERFEKAAEGKGGMYPMHRPRRGVFLLVSNEHFKEARENKVDLADRDGTKKDFFALKNLFEQLDFEVVEKINRTKQEMQEDIQAQALKDHTSYDCFVCAVLTHGERDMVYGIDGDTLDLDELKDAVDGSNCPTLVGKPKLFFIQACQGKKFDHGAGVPGGFGAAGPNPAPACVDKEVEKAADKFVNLKVTEKTQSDAAPEGRVSGKSDVFVAMATVPDFVSWRNTSWGTWFVQAVVYVFSRLAHRYELMSLMTKVNRLVSKAETSKGLKQVSVFKSALTSDFYFFPGLKNCGVVESHSETDLANSQPQQPASKTDSIGSGIVSQPTDGVDGGKSVFVP